MGKYSKNIHQPPDTKNKLLLDNLPRRLAGYGKSLQQGDSAVIVVMDVDTQDCKQLKVDLLEMLQQCDPQPRTLFRIAIEEIEAWLLGDRAAIKTAYPNARTSVLKKYVQDSICGTWELLADAIYPGGAAYLKSKGFPVIGQVKCEWAENIAPFVDVENNASKSFQVFRDGVRRFAVMNDKKEP